MLNGMKFKIKLEEHLRYTENIEGNFQQQQHTFSFIKKYSKLKQVTNYNYLYLEFLSTRQEKMLTNSITHETLWYNAVFRRTLQ